jgi:integrase
MNASALTKLVGQYLEHRRSLGYSLHRYDRPLLQFARFHQHEAPGKPLQTELMLKWAVLPGTGNRSYYTKRLARVRGFAQYCATFDPRTQIPDYRLLGRGYARVAPHIYTDRQITLLLRRARRLPTERSLIRNLTYETFLGLVACTGLRTCEARALRCSDFDAKNRTLTIRKTKFSPERVLPLHPTAARALQHYLNVRLPLAPNEPSFFINRHNHPLRQTNVHETFREIAQGIVSTGIRPPRIYDLRHTFATKHIARWNRAGVSTAHHLLLLSRYMGHQNFSDTWWYVSPDAGALRRSASRFEHFFKEGPHAR